MLTYTATQVLLGEGERTKHVVGGTRQVAGQFALNYDDPRDSDFGLIPVNLSPLDSGDCEQDEALRSNWLEFERFPLAYFLVKEVRGFPPDFRAARPLNFQLVGDLTLRGHPDAALWDTTATLYLDRIKGIATTHINLADYGIPLLAVPGLIEMRGGVEEPEDRCECPYGDINVMSK
ncbi:MAG: YceI family protein [Anaerolineae bacterium]